MDKPRNREKTAFGPVKFIIFMIIPLVCLATALEGSCRLYDLFKNHKRNAGTKVCEKIEVVRHPFLYSKLAPNQHTGCATINSYGFRGRDFKPVPGENVYRILVTGGSVVYGVFHNSDENTIPFMLEDYLNETSPYDNLEFEVINAGMPAYNSTQELFLIETLGLDIKPDMVISFGGYNDMGYRFQDEWRPYYPLFFKTADENNDDKVLNTYQLFKNLSRRSSFFRKLFARVEGAVTSERIEHRKVLMREQDDYFEDNAPVVWLKNIKIIGDVLEAEGVRFIVVLQPSLFMSADTGNQETVKRYDYYVKHDKADSIKRVCSRYRRAADGAKESAKKGDFIFLDYSILTGDSRIFLDQCHLSVTGNGIVARQLGDEILKLVSRDAAAAVP